jgi:hypothetical protein
MFCLGSGCTKPESSQEISLLKVTSFSDPRFNAETSYISEVNHPSDYRFLNMKMVFEKSEDFKIIPLRFVNGAYSEMFFPFDIPGHYIDTIYRPRLIIRDTSFITENLGGDIKHAGPNILQSFIYTISKVKDRQFRSRKCAFTDSSYYQDIYYDEDFRINKIVLVYDSIRYVFEK